MKHSKHSLRLMAWLLALALGALSLAGCSLNLAEDEPDTTVHEVFAEAGGEEPPFSETFDQNARFGTEIVGDTLCVVYNGIMTRNTPYFTSAGDTITIVAEATTESERLTDYRAVLWRDTGDGNTQYVEGGTLFFNADASYYTGSFTGLDPNSRYKITIAYDSTTYYIYGKMSIHGLTSAEELETDSVA